MRILLQQLIQHSWIRAVNSEPLGEGFATATYPRSSDELSEEMRSGIRSLSPFLFDKSAFQHNIKVGLEYGIY